MRIITLDNICQKGYGMSLSKIIALGDDV
jgi:hypothetical protein